MKLQCLQGYDFIGGVTFGVIPAGKKERRRIQIRGENMPTLFDVVQLTKMMERTNGEVFYNLVAFRNQLEKLNKNNLSVTECIITPYYIHNGYLYELYEYELSVSLTDKRDFHQYLLKRTGRKEVKEIPDEIVNLHRECHIEVLKNDCRLPIKRLQQYIDFLCSSKELISQVHKVFGTFQYDDLWFSFY